VEPAPWIRTCVPHIKGSILSAYFRRFIIHTVHILQHDSAVTGFLPGGELCVASPTLFQNNLARQRYRSESIEAGNKQLKHSFREI
jgi:hypothetical protein